MDGMTVQRQVLSTILSGSLPRKELQFISYYQQKKKKEFYNAKRPMP